MTKTGGPGRGKTRTASDTFSEYARILNATHTQQRIAELLGVPQQTVTRWLSNNAGVGNATKTDHRVKLDRDCVPIVSEEAEKDGKKAVSGGNVDCKKAVSRRGSPHRGV